MLPRELVDYIDMLKTLRPLPPQEAVRQELMRGGWNDDEIQRSLELFTAEKADLPSAAHPATENFVMPDWVHHEPQKEEKLSIKDPISQSAAPADPISPAPVQLKKEAQTVSVPKAAPSIRPKDTPVLLKNPPGVPAPLPKANGSRIGLKIGIAMLVIFIVSGGTGFYAYANRLWMFDQPPFSSGDYASGFSREFKELISGNFSASLTSEVIERSGGQLQAAGSFGAGLPLNSKASVSISGAFDTASGSFDSTLFGEGRYGDFLAVADIDILQKGDSQYIRFKKFPQFIANGNIESVQGTWIRASSAELRKLAEANGIPSAVARRAGEFSEVSWPVLLSQGFAAAFDSGLLTLSGEPEKDEQNPQLYKYVFSLNPQLAEEWIDSFENNLRSIGFSQKDALASEEITVIAEILGAIRKDMSIALWTTRKGDISKLGLMYRVLPPGDPWKNKELRSLFSLTFDTKGERQPAEAPTEFISTSQAALLMSGLSKEVYALRQQISQIEKVQGALEYYALIHDKEYPDTIEKMVAERGEDVWSDLYTGEPLSYSKLGDTYALRYMVELPPYDAKKSEPWIRIENKKASLRYIPGLNTADNQSISIEAAAAAMVDTDKDGLSDTLEGYAGTDAKKKDTDGNGVSDIDEFTSRVLSSREE